MNKNQESEVKRMSRVATPEKMTAFGREVTQRLLEKGISQTDLAKRIYLNHVYLNRMFYGKYPVQMRTIVSIAKELDLDAAELARMALNDE